ncbi:MAG: DNA topology modulation protein [Dehalococcoidia bacterium]
MDRIMVIGSGGSGKSTLARKIGAALDIEVIHLDALFWRPGWVETPREQWEEIQRALAKRDRWVMDGNYGGTLDIRLRAADTVVFLDMPRTLCLWRIVSRRLRYTNQSRPDMAPGCEERLTWEFIRWVWTYPTRRRPSILTMLSAYAPGRRVIRLRSTRAVAGFVDSLRDVGTSA